MMLYQTRFFRISWLLLLSVLSQTAFAQDLLYPHSFTPATKIPAGCLSKSPLELKPNNELFFDDVIDLHSPIDTGSYRIRVWRIGCHEPGRSAIAVNFQAVDEAAGFIPLPSAELFDLDGNKNPAALLLFPANGPGYLRATASGSLTKLTEGNPSGVTMIVDTDSDSMTATQYNEIVGLRLTFDSQELIIGVLNYVASLDPPQFEAPPLHGRYSGLWIAADLPRTGLVFHSGGTLSERLYVFTFWLTYIEGAPVWLIGESDIGPEDSSIELDLHRYHGGKIITDPSFSEEDVSSEIVGTMTLSARHCNLLEVGIDLTSLGKSSRMMQLTRLTRIAGFDCDQTQ